MKILILSPYYFPYINPRAHRWTSIAEHWAMQGHEVHVICSKNKNYPSQYQQNGVHICRKGFNSLKEVLYYYSNTVKRGETSQKKRNNESRGVLLQKIHDKILRNIYFPDDSFPWYRPAIIAAKKLLEQGDFSVLITSSLPFSPHLVGLHLKKKYPNLKWIADTGDPFAFQPLHPLNNNFLYGKLNIRAEKRVAQNADTISLTNEGALRFYKEKFPFYANKFVSIPPILKRSENVSTNLIAKSENLKFGYFGSFFRKVREPKRLLDFIQILHTTYPILFKNAEWHFYGNIFENFLKEFTNFRDKNIKLKLHGLVTRKRVEEEMQKMNFLINVGNATEHQLPSKSTDYLASGKPIINLTLLRKDTFAEFLESYPLIFNVYNGEISNELLEFLNINREEKVSEEEIKLRCEPFSVESIAKKYMKMIKKVKS